MVGPKLRVAVCGAGIGGLVLAVALSQYPDIEVVVFEAASKLGEVGAGVGLFPRAWEVIRRLGLENDLLRAVDVKCKDGPVCTFAYRKSDHPKGLDFYTLITQGNLMAFHRSDFQQVLLNRLDPEKTQCTKRLRTYTQKPSEPVKLFFEDGTVTHCDVLVGADGLKSAVRKALFTEKANHARSEGRHAEAARCVHSIDPVWSGTNAFRALISAERLEARYPNHRVLTQPTQYLGKDAYVIAYPISRGKLINFVAFITRHDLENTNFDGAWFTPGDRRELVESFQGWEPEVEALIECVETPLRWSIHTVRPLPSFVHGRVALIGDAAHAMLPHQGSGAGQAIEDAYILATLLGHERIDGSRASIHRALKIYDRVRRPRALDVQERSRLNGQYFTLMFKNINFSDLQGQDLFRALVRLLETVKQNWEWAWSSSPDDILNEALQLLTST